MNTATVDPAASPLPTEEHYARNLVGGEWRFPAAPYEFEIRNPADSTISAVVPLSSRFDVADAVHAGHAALSGVWADAGERLAILHDVVASLRSAAAELGQLLALETGLAPADSRAVVAATVQLAERLVADGALTATNGRRQGVSGHILSWGAPLTDAVTSVLPALLRGDTVVVKPSLRGPLTPVALALLATEAGLPAGVLNIVQGTGGDVGADLFGRADLVAMQVRAGERTIAQAGRAHARTGVPLRVLRAGGDVVVVGPDFDSAGPDLDVVAEAVATSVRMNNAGGPFGLPLLAVHAAHAGQVIDAVAGRLAGIEAAPLPTEPLRRRALQRIDSLLEHGATVALGGSGFPDDITHRMSWRLPPSVLLLGGPDSAAARCEQAITPLGPVLGVAVWDRPEQVQALFTADRARDGVAVTWGVGADVAALLPHGQVVAGAAASVRPIGSTLAPSWTAGA